MNPGASDFESAPSSLPHSFQKTRSIACTEPGRGPELAEGTQCLWVCLTFLSVCHFPGASTGVKDAALGDLPRDSHPQQRLPWFPALPASQVSSTDKRSKTGALRMQNRAGPQLGPQAASTAHLWEGGRLSPREVTTQPWFQPSLRMSRASMTEGPHRDPVSTVPWASCPTL